MQMRIGFRQEEISLHNAPATHLYFDNDHVDGLVVKEFLTVFNFLQPTQIKKFFNIDSRRRLYFCPAL